MKHIINQYYIDKDKLNYILYERYIVDRGAHKGSESFKAIGYYGYNLHSLKMGILSKCIHDNFFNMNVTELLDMIDKIILKMEEVK